MNKYKEGWYKTREVFIVYLPPLAMLQPQSTYTICQYTYISLKTPVLVKIRKKDTKCLWRKYLYIHFPSAS